MRALLLALALAVSGCGGGDEASPVPPPAPPPAADPTLDYVAIGDSTGFGIGGDPPLGDGGYPRRLAERLSATGLEVTLHNFSVPGATAADAFDVQVPAAARLADVDLVTVCIGVNDAGTSRTPAEFGTTMARIFEATLRLAGAPAVVACNIPDASLTPRRADEPPSYREHIVALNGALEAEARARGIPVVDLFGQSGKLLVEPGLLFVDGFHPSAEGYEVWADLMFPTVQAAVAP